MKRVSVAIVVLLILILLGVGIVYLLKQNGEEEAVEQLSADLLAPDFSFPDASGKSIVLSELGAELRIVNFWASWSPYSKTELPALARIADEYEADVAVVALNRDTNPEDGKAFLTSLNLGDLLLFAYDAGDTYFKEVGGYAMPETLVIDRAGTILFHARGPLSEEQLRQKLDLMLD